VRARAIKQARLSTCAVCVVRVRARPTHAAAGTHACCVCTTTTTTGHHRVGRRPNGRPAPRSPSHPPAGTNRPCNATNPRRCLDGLCTSWTPVAQIDHATVCLDRSVRRSQHQPAGRRRPRRHVYVRVDPAPTWTPTRRLLSFSLQGNNSHHLQFSMPRRSSSLACIGTGRPGP